MNLNLEGRVGPKGPHLQPGLTVLYLLRYTDGVLRRFGFRTLYFKHLFKTPKIFCL